MNIFLVCEWQGNFYVREEIPRNTTIYMDYVHATYDNADDAYNEVDLLQQAYDTDPANWN